MPLCRMTFTAIKANFVFVAASLSVYAATSLGASTSFASASVSMADPLADPQNPNQKGPFTVVRGEYKFAAKVDAEVLKGAKTELWANVFWPTDLAIPRPILFFMHGNHGTCRLLSSSGEADDTDCTYTNRGTCPAGMSVIQNQAGYDYMASHLASYGYVVVSINSNRGITCGAGYESDFGLNLARGRLVLRHMENWKKWSSTGGAPRSIGGTAETFVNKIDFSNVGLMGHSRGGEGMRAAYNLYRDKGSVWPARIPGTHFKGIFEIGAVDGQTARTLDADDVSWNQLLPLCDGDVSELDGRLPFERMLKKSNESTPTPKSLYMVWGTNHNFFNSQWWESDSDACTGHTPIFGKGPTSAAQQQIATTATTAFFLSTVGSAPVAAFAQLLNPLYALPSYAQGLTRLDRDYIPSFDQKSIFNIDSFNFPTGKSSYGIDNAAEGIRVAHQSTQPNRAKIEWDARSGTPPRYFQVNWAPENLGYDVSMLDSVDFRVGRQPSYTGVTTPTDFSIALADSGNQLSEKLPISRYAQVLGPANEVDLFQTIRIPMKDFKVPAGSGVRGVRFLFDRSDRGALFLANVHFSGYYPSPRRLPIEPGTLEIPDVAEELRIKKPKIFQAEVLTLQKAQRLDGTPTVEITFASLEKFKPEAALPVLVIDGKQFLVSRYDGSGSTSHITFSLPADDFAALPARAEMQVQYGRRHPKKIWQLPAFHKEALK
jgi:hypothetical protein